jgi:hypothetical protein
MTPKESEAWKGPPGFSTDILPFYETLARQIPKGGRFAEVGCFLGRSLAFMGTLRPDIELYAIDTWEDEPSQGYPGPQEYAPLVAHHGGLFLAFLALLPKDVLSRTRILRARSHRALPMLPPIDAIFIDGAHDEASVRDDIADAKGVVVSGGIISGHDYCGFNADGSGGNGIVAALQGKEIDLMPWPKDDPHEGWRPGHGTCWSFVR